jgi:hypothetical protein
MSYKQLRVWARGVNSGWGTDGELQFYIKIARDDNNFYMYRTPINSGTSRDAWLPEINVDFERLFALRSQIQNAYLQNKQRNTCTGLDSVLIANTPLPTGVTAASRYAACDGGYIVYTLDPGSSPPNLAAVQELSVGMMRVPVPPGVSPILPADTLEMWVDDIRLTGVVNEPGFASQVGLNIAASDFADIRILASRRDGNFRQLAEAPTFLTDNNVDISSAFRLEKLFPASLGLSIPLTVNYTSASQDPFYLSQSDIQGDAIEGLRTPRSAAASVTLSLRRTKQSTGSIWSPILNNLTLASAYTTGNSRSEYQDGRAKNFVVGLDFNLSRALLGDIARWSPTEIHLTSAYTNGKDDRTSFLKPASALDDTGQAVKGITKTWRNGVSLVFRPVKAASLHWDITSIRDLRAYGSDSQLGLIATSDHDRVLGYDTGLERERAMQAGINISPPITAWFRPRLDFGTSYNMLRDPNTLDFARVDSTGFLRIPRRLGNSQTTTAGLTLDLPRAVKLYTDSASFLRGVLEVLQPLDINFNRSLLSVYDGSAAGASLAYQLGLGGINTFREIGSEPATAAGLVTQFSVNESLNLPFGATIAARYQRINTRNWTRRMEQGLDIFDGKQTIFPDIALRWTGQPVLLKSIISSLGANARMLETRQFNGTQPTDDIVIDDRGEIRVRSWPLSGSVVFAGTRPLSATVGYSLSKQLDDKPGLTANANNADFSIDVAKPWKLPTDWNARSDLRTRISYQRSQGQNFVVLPTNFVVDPLAESIERRLTDNGRHAFSMSADTPMSQKICRRASWSRVWRASTITLTGASRRPCSVR